jgi:hypothetical protein
MEPFKWECPHCNHKTTIINSNYSESNFGLSIANADGGKVLSSYFIVCPNNECNKFTLGSILYDSSYEFRNGRWNHFDQKEIKRWRHVPNSSTKNFPDYIPKDILEDYKEACAIIDQSSKASATLSRRCLQQMVRDFWEVKGNSLFEEIESIEEHVDLLTLKPINATKEIGGIANLMKKDCALLIDAEPKEAKALIRLVEILFKNWYISNHEKELMFYEILNSEEV